MSEERLILAIIVGIILIGTAIKYWRVVIGLGAVGALAVGFLCLQGKIDCPLGGNRQSGSTPIGYARLKTSKTDLIFSVYQHVKGKRYQSHRTKNWNARVPCTKDEDNADLGKGNPYLGKCRGSGGYGYGYKTVARRDSREIMKRCPDPPPVNSPSWHVRETGPDTWIVSNPQGRWTVKKVGQSLRISAHQKC
jgi:hypothetical protein